MVEIEQVVDSSSGPTTELPETELRKSVVDALFDALTLRAAKGLFATKDALEKVARWLDARAKLAGELATKLATPSRDSSVEKTSGSTAS
ncbi:MAG TPA: hypothetical protein VM925_36490 [Labilithrix sp.]|nr:hypothetical protein [Labilithrix sp.]